MLDETDQARDLVARRPDLGVGGAHDIAPLVMRARRGGRLAGTELLEILDTLVAAGTRRRGAARRASAAAPRAGPLDQAAAAAARAARAEPRPGRRAARLGLARAGRPAPRGAHRLRAAALAARDASSTRATSPARSRSRSSRCATAATSSPSVPTPRGRVKGIVHDQSGSGQTLFIEPLVVVELGNAWREAQLAAQAEEERILDELSALVDSQADALDETLAALATFDFWIARARLAGELDAIRAGDVDRRTRSSCCPRAIRA